jgi:hypothetical protein
MLNKLLGILVWKGGKWYLRRRYGAAMAPRSVLVGGLALVVGGVLLAARHRNGGD